METRVSKLILIKNGKVLLVKEIEKDKYSLPGGRVEENETAEGGLIREIKEELGCRPLNYKIYKETSISGWNEGEIYHFIYFIGDLEGDLKCSSEVEKLVWADKNLLKNGSITLHPHMIKTSIIMDLVDNNLVN